MLGNECQLCCLIPFLNDVLFSHEADFVTPLDPDFTLAIWPEAAFPFLPLKNRLIWMSDEHPLASARGSPMSGNDATFLPIT